MFRSQWGGKNALYITLASKDSYIFSTPNLAVPTSLKTYLKNIKQGDRCLDNLIQRRVQS